MADEQVERFAAWGSRIMGGVGLLVAGVVVALGVADPYPPVVYPVCGLVGLLFWAMLIRPGVAVGVDRLELRNAFSTVRVPLAAIEELAVRQWIAVRAGDRTYNCSGIGRSYRQAVRDDRRGDQGRVDLASLSYGAVAEARIKNMAENARARQGITPYSDEQLALAADVRREPARIELGLLALLVVALVLTLFL